MKRSEANGNENDSRKETGRHIMIDRYWHPHLVCRVRNINSSQYGSYGNKCEI